MAGAQEPGRAGLTLGHVIAEAQWFSSQASKNLRFLAAGGLAIVWVLAGNDLSALRRVPMFVATLGFVLALGADFLHYDISAKRAFTVIDRNHGVAHDTVVTVSRADAPAFIWYKRKMRVLTLAYVALLCAFFFTVFPEVGVAVRWVAAAATK